MRKFVVTAQNLGPKKTLYSIDIFADEAEKSEDITLITFIKEHRFEGKDKNYLKAFQILRDKALNCGFGIQCCGSLINVMQPEEFKGTDIIYIIDTHNPADQGQAVSIFDHAIPPRYYLTYKQEQYLVQWNRALKKYNRKLKEEQK